MGILVESTSRAIKPAVVSAYIWDLKIDGQTFLSKDTERFFFPAPQDGTYELTHVVTDSLGVPSDPFVLKFKYENKTITVLPKGE